jgi:signal transduction histidine kinase
LDDENQPPGASPANSEGYPPGSTATAAGPSSSNAAGFSSGTAAAATRALVALRVVGFVWAVAAVLVSTDQLTRPAIAIGLLVVAGVITAAPLPRSVREGKQLGGDWLVAELVTGFALAASTGIVYEHNGVGPSSIATLGGMWPLVGVLAAGVRWGGKAGALAGAWFGLARLVGSVTASDGWPDASQTFSVASTAILSIVAGVLAAATLRWAGTLEARAAMAAARERLAREVHDGVLQTLAAIEARTSDPDAARLARAEARRVREHLFGANTTGRSLDAALTEVLGAVEDRFGVRCELAVVEHVDLPDDLCRRLVGAVGEAATNAAKHGGVGCTVLVLPDDDGITVTVHDEGVGFDPDATEQGVGLRSSVHARISEVGGTVDVDSAPGRGCEVRLWLPFASS